MGDPKGFLKIKRQVSEYRPVCERVKDYGEVICLRGDQDSQQQASRCMDCGVPYCHWGCPVGNIIPEWNDLTFMGNWQKAYELLRATNNLPEVTGRVCPAPCEYACVLGINDDPVTIRENELSIIEYGFKSGLIKPRPVKKRSGKKVAVIGSGPAGIACADQLNQAGHKVVVFERDDKVGGVMRYGIPDFKLDKRVIDRRIKLLKAEGIEFQMSANIGIDYKVNQDKAGKFSISGPKFKKFFDALCLTGGSRTPRDLKIEGRELKGVYFAMDYLIQSNKRILGAKISQEELIDARGKNVVVIGGGDTGADCVGTAHRQGAKCVVQLELLPKPSECRTKEHPWPKYPVVFKTSSSHQEGGERKWQILTKKFIGRDGKVEKISCVKVDFSCKDERGCPVMKELVDETFEIEADLVVLAMGFLHPEHKGLIHELAVELDQRGNVKTGSDFMTSRKGIFSAGDMRRGQSLIVWAITEGRQAAYSIDQYLAHKSLPPNI